MAQLSEIGRTDLSQSIKSPWFWITSAGILGAIVVIAFVLLGGSPIGAPQATRALTSDEEGYGPIPVKDSRPSVALSAISAATTPAVPGGFVAPAPAAPGANAALTPPAPPAVTGEDTNYVPPSATPGSEAVAQYSDAGLPPAPVLHGNGASGGSSYVSSQYQAPGVSSLGSPASPGSATSVAD